MTRVYPIGYTAHDSARFIAQIMRDEKMLTVDCRLSPRSRIAEWNGDVLAGVWGQRYRFAGAYLGNAALHRNQERKAQYIGQKPYRNEIEIKDPVRGINGLQYYLKREHHLILLCQCWDFYNCHLSEVTRLLLERVPDIEVIRRDVPVSPNVYPFVPGQTFLDCEMADCGKASLWTYYPGGHKEHPIALCDQHRQQLQASHKEVSGHV